jgi:hypothetical protein
MEQDITTGEIYRLLLKQSADITEIKADVKAQNGKVAGHETRLTVLEDRSPGRAGGISGGGVAAAVTLLLEGGKKLFGG